MCADTPCMKLLMRPLQIFYRNTARATIAAEKEQEVDAYTEPDSSNRHAFIKKLKIVICLLVYL